MKHHRYMFSYTTRPARGYTEKTSWMLPSFLENMVWDVPGVGLIRVADHPEVKIRQIKNPKHLDDLYPSAVNREDPNA